MREKGVSAVLILCIGPMFRNPNPNNFLPLSSYMYHIIGFVDRLRSFAHLNSPRGAVALAVPPAASALRTMFVPSSPLC